MVAQALQESLKEYERQGKDGRNVLVKQFRKRLEKVTSLIAQCHMAASSSPAQNGADEQKTVGFQQIRTNDDKMLQSGGTKGASA
jgi:hypothetical protein